MTTHRSLLVLGLAALLPAVLPAAQDQSIAISATAIAGYVRPKDANGRPRPESYVFSEGQFFDGSTVDHSLEKTTFANITKMLAVNLAKQNYYPTPDAMAADLLIMVHWGTTTVYVDPQKDFNLQAAQDALAKFNAAQDSGGGLADTSELNLQTSALAAAQESVQGSIRRNAILLGYARVLERERRAMSPTEAMISMSNELNEERYFVILMAYDNHLRTTEHKSKLLWSTRLSVRSPGNNFIEALPALAQAGSRVYGQHMDDLVRVKTPLGTVKLGELEVIGPADAPSSAKPEKSDK